MFSMLSVTIAVNPFAASIGLPKLPKLNSNLCASVVNLLEPSEDA